MVWSRHKVDGLMNGANKGLEIAKLGPRNLRQRSQKKKPHNKQTNKKPNPNKQTKKQNWEDGVGVGIAYAANSAGKIGFSPAEE